MVEGKKKSRTLRRVNVRTPGGNVKTHYRPRKPKAAECASCGKVLHGVPRLNSAKMRNTPKTKKRPERPYGGVLCSACMRKKIIEKSRK